MEFIKLILRSSAKDVSYMTDEEYINCMNIPFDSLKYFETVPKELCTGEKIMHKSLSIGSPVSQIFGVFYLHRLDNYIKIVEGIHGYARYMDDGYCIHNDYFYLEYILNKSRDIISNELGMFLNEKKSIITTLDDFSFLHRNYSLHKNGHIVKSTPRDTFLREERKLRKWYNLYLDGRIDPLDIIESYLSWRGTIVGNKKRLERTDKLVMDIYNIL